jgi:hypothetical protein
MRIRAIHVFAVIVLISILSPYMGKKLEDLLGAGFNYSTLVLIILWQNKWVKSKVDLVAFIGLAALNILNLLQLTSAVIHYLYVEMYIIIVCLTLILLVINKYFCKDERNI